MTHLRGDLKSKKWIVAKGILFLAIAGASAALILLQSPSIKLAALLVILVWASCRFYYFLFYVLERYVDPTLRYAGLWDLTRTLLRNRRDASGSEDAAPRRSVTKDARGHSDSSLPSESASGSDSSPKSSSPSNGSSP
jgi:hypothetical protein